MLLRSSCPVVLASASPRRRELLAALGIAFTVVPAEVDEIGAEQGYPAEETVRLNAVLKAEAVARTCPGSLVIGADTVVECGGRICGKPRGPEDAAAMLRALSGREHRVMTGVAFRLEKNRLERSFTEISRVTFKPLSEQTIRTYMELVDVLDKAGAYAIQEHSELIVERLDGSLSNVIGLPVERLAEELCRAGVAERSS
ncbi:MAG: septum formation protein Maf [Lentisphaeria bacterium]|nr:septum formation protein Maf [Lentisphaeria bacterium]